MNQVDSLPVKSRVLRSDRSRSLRWRLVPLLAGMLLISLLLVGSGVFVLISRNEQRSWQGRQREAALHAGETVAGFIQQAVDMLRLVSTVDGDYLVAEPEVMRDFLDQNPALLEVVRLEKSGRVVASAYRGSPVLAHLFTIPQSSWFLAAKGARTGGASPGGLYLGSLQISAGNEPYLIMAIPAPDGGVVAARLHMDKLWDTVADIRFGESGQAYVVNQNGEIIGHARPDVALARTSLEGRPEMEKLSEAANNEWQGSYQNFEGVWVVGVTHLVPGTDWVVMTELPQSEAFAVSRMALLLVGGGMLVFGTLMVFMMTRFFLRRLVIERLERLGAGARQLGRGDLSHRIMVDQQDEIGQLAEVFNGMADELQDVYEQIEARTRDLERRNGYMRATSTVARDASSVLDLQELLSRVAALVSQQFGFYHTGIFLLDSSGEWAVLQASSSQGGQSMLARGHRLKVGEVGIVGYVTGTGEARIALDVGQDAVYFDNPDLPETRSEMALPLRVRGEIIGALDVQSTEPEAFSDEDVAMLQALADEIAMAISNAQLFERLQESLEAERQVYGELSRRAWSELLRAHPDLGFLSSERGISRAGDVWGPHVEVALETEETTSGDGDGKGLAIPIKVRGQVVGVIDAHKPENRGQWSAQEIALMETITQQLSTALESARLYQDTQRRAARERVIGEVTARMRETLDVEMVLKTAAQEVRQALGLPEVVVHLVPQSADGAGHNVQEGEA